MEEADALWIDYPTRTIWKEWIPQSTTVKDLKDSGRWNEIIETSYNAFVTKLNFFFGKVTDIHDKNIVLCQEPGWDEWYVIDVGLIHPSISNLASGNTYKYLASRIYLEFFFAEKRTGL